MAIPKDPNILFILQEKFLQSTECTLDAKLKSKP